MKVELKVDIRPVKHMLNDVEERLLEGMDPKSAKRKKGVIFGRALQRVDTHIKAMVAREISNIYEIRVGDAKKMFRTRRIYEDGHTAGLEIPLVSVRGKMGKQYAVQTAHAAAFTLATRRSAGWKRGRYEKVMGLEAKVLKERPSVLPKVMFRAANGNVMQRMQRVRGKNSHKDRLRPAVGIASPQMAMNRAAPRIVEESQQMLAKRIAHEAEYELKKLAAKKYE